MCHILFDGLRNKLLKRLKNSDNGFLGISSYDILRFNMASSTRPKHENYGALSEALSDLKKRGYKEDFNLNPHYLECVSMQLEL